MQHVVFVEFNRLVAHSVGAELSQILTDDFSVMEHTNKEFGRFGRVYTVKFLHPEVIKAKFPIKECG